MEGKGDRGWEGRSEGFIEEKEEGKSGMKYKKGRENGESNDNSPRKPQKREYTVCACVAEECFG